jgi:transposase
MKAKLLYLPPYSLDFNPIENVFAKLKEPPSEPSTASGTPSPSSCRPSLQPNAQTTSPPQGTAQPERIPL